MGENAIRLFLALRHTAQLMGEELASAAPKVELLLILAPARFATR